MFLKKAINLENQLADIRKRKHQAFVNRNAINVNDSLINLKVRDNINIIPGSTVIINHKKNDSKNANTKYKKIKKKTVLVVGDSMANGIEESKLSKTRDIRVQPVPGGKIQQNLKDLLHEDYPCRYQQCKNRYSTNDRR